MREGDGKFQYFGFVKFGEAEDAALAIEELNGKKIDDKIDDEKLKEFCVWNTGEALSTFAEMAIQQGSSCEEFVKAEIANNEIQFVVTSYPEFGEYNKFPLVTTLTEDLKDLLKQQDEFEAKIFEERAALAAKYQKLYDPLYTERYEIVHGVIEIEESTEPTEEVLGEENAVEEKGVPNFWLTAVKTIEMLAEEIQERGEGALKYLKDIKWSRIDNPKGCKLEFFFYLNPYFTNTVLVKTYHKSDEDKPILEKAIETEIQWLPGKSLTKKVLNKPKEGPKNTKPITKTENCESFFNFFSPSQFPDDDDSDEETAEQLQNKMEQDYDVGSTIRDKIIPHVVSWFTGEAVHGDKFNVIEREGDEDDEDVDDDDYEEDTAAKNRPKKVSVGRKVKRGVPHGERQERPLECNGPGNSSDGPVKIDFRIMESDEQSVSTDGKATEVSDGETNHRPEQSKSSSYLPAKVPTGSNLKFG
ncbi:nucleosome assembly protein 1;2-like [Aristolochia californica]|uniref:nucleosome assembly protein 1;2-like n=1 Tax=Aristolochia californica TaxID=171875 RepID=UPI0035DC1B7B